LLPSDIEPRWKHSTTIGRQQPLHDQQPEELSEILATTHTTGLPGARFSGLALGHNMRQNTSETGEVREVNSYYYYDPYSGYYYYYDPYSGYYYYYA
jgi:hypothetical protein